MSVESKLIKLFEADIEAILNHINNEENEFLYSFIKDFEPEGYIYYFDYHIFEDLVNCYCFKIFESDPLERTIPDNRLSLFRKIFLDNMDFSNRRIIRWFNNSSYYSEGRLYLLLFHHLFTESLYTEIPISKILKNALFEWKNALSTRKMPIELYLVLNDTFFEDDRKNFRITSDLKLMRLYSYIILEGASKSQLSKSFHNFLSILLKKSATQSFDHNFYGKFYDKSHSMNNYKEEYQDIINRIRYFMLSFYLNGHLMLREDVEIITPWWIQEDLKEFKTSDIHFKKNKLGLNELNQMKIMFDEIVELNIFQDSELDLVLFNYNELHNKDLISELILYDFIILENIFTRGSKTEVTFRLSLNLALFISETKEEFKRIFQISKKLYGIRSAIIHGGNWPKKLRKEKLPEKLGLDNNVKEELLARAVHEHLMKYINKTLRKLIQLKTDRIKDNKSSQIFKDFEGLYFLMNSKLVKFLDNSFS